VILKKSVGHILTRNTFIKKGSGQGGRKHALKEDRPGFKSHDPFKL
jgi:hypothetical protein